MELRHKDLLASTLAVLAVLGTALAAESPVGSRHQMPARGELAEDRIGEAAAGPPATTSDAFVTLAAADFASSDPNQILYDTNRHCLAPTCLFWAGVPVPHGATIVGVEVDGCDDVVGDGLIQVFLSRAPGNGGDLDLLVDFEVSVLGCHYTTERVDPPHTVDQYLGNYVVLVAIAGGGQAHRFQAVRIYYRSGDGEVVPTGTEPTLFP